jgi:hypothetical protein
MQGKSNDSAETASAVADEYIDVDDYYTAAVLLLVLCVDG